jgi:hypothetical protein
MSDSRTYVIEALRPLSDMTPGRDTLTERTVEAWVVLDIITTDGLSWNVFEDWFNAQPEDTKRGGRYRLTKPSDQYPGGTYDEYVVSPSWRVETPHVEAVEEVVS